MDQLTNGSTGANGNERRRPWRRYGFGLIAALATLIGSLAVGSPAADAAPRIPPPMTNCADNDCAARAGEAAIRAFLGEQGTGSGQETVGVIGCERQGNICITRYFLVTVQLENGEAVLVTTRMPWFSRENCGDIGGLD